MSRIKSSELKQKNNKTLYELLHKQRAHLRDLYFSLSGAQLKNVHEVKDTKRNIAAILTFLKRLKEK